MVNTPGDISHSTVDTTKAHWYKKMSPTFGTDFPWDSIHQAHHRLPSVVWFQFECPMTITEGVRRHLL